MRGPSQTRPFCRAAPSLLVAVLVSSTGLLRQNYDASTALAADASAAPSPTEVPLAFDKEIGPLLVSRCGKCHGEKVREAALDLSSKTAMLKGGDSGPALVPGSADKSLLYEKIIAGEMPPEDHPKLAGAQVALIKRWIDTGAHGGESIVAPLDANNSDEPVPNFQPLARPPVPSVRSARQAQTPIDLFLLQKLETKGLTFSPPAERHALIRRLYLDVIGLPPAPAQVDAFVADQNPNAVAHLVDRLLESPQFGERWARHWLDAAGFSDVYGTDNDAAIIKLGKGKWRYRDYVIQSFNEDKPYDAFLTEQLAGDELVDWRHATKMTPQIERLLVATGMLTFATDNTDEKELRTREEMHGIVQRTAELLASNVLGLTLKCAKCHNHKYEPITQRDYYSLVALLTPAYNPEKWLSPIERQLPDLSGPDKTAIEKHNAELDRKQTELRSRIEATEGPARRLLFEDKLARLPETIRDDVRAAIERPAAQRDEVQKYLVRKFQPQVHVRPAETRAALAESVRKQLESLDKQISELDSQRREWGVIHAVYDVGPAPATYLLKRGDLNKPGDEVPAKFLEALSSGELPIVQPAAGTSGRRLALARLLTDWRSPGGGLVARVMANRIWQHLMGRGIVDTTDNLGRSGARPTHPELLEWLASEFVAGGARIKPLIREIVLSSAYQQTSSAQLSGISAVAMASDPENHLWWRMPVRRLDSEVVRDTLLAVSGNLNPKMGGPSVWIDVLPDGTPTVDLKKLASPLEANRRTIYLLARRSYHLPLLGVFDQPIMATNAPLRDPSTVVLQSLTMLNDSFVVAQAVAFAERVKQIAPAGTAPQQVRIAFKLAYGRAPEADEAAMAEDLVEHHRSCYAAQGNSADQAARQALEQLCRMLLNSSEFIYTP